jgi:NIPSNAP
MGKYLLQVKYRLRAHNMDRFEKILTTEVIPLAEKMGLNLSGVWRTSIGKAGEYMEHWEFNSMEELDRDWKALINHPEIRRIFEITGPMVEDETFSIHEPIWKKQ